MLVKKHEDYLEEFENLKRNLEMFLEEVNTLPSSDISFLIKFNNLKTKYFTIYNGG